MRGREITRKMVEKLRRYKTFKDGTVREIPLSASECGIKTWGIVDYSMSKAYREAGGKPLKVEL